MYTVNPGGWTFWPRTFWPGRFGHGRFGHGRFDHGRFDHGRFDHGRFDHGRFGHGRFGHGRFGQIQVQSRMFWPNTFSTWKEASLNFLRFYTYSLCKTKA